MKEIDFRYDLLPLKDKLFRLALRITLDTAEAEDVTQDTLIRVWERRAALAGIASLEGYCLTVCHNLALDRSQRREAANRSLDEQPVDTPDSAPLPDERMEREERRQRVRRIIDSLPATQRTVLQLRDIEGKTYREVADITGLTEANVKVTLFRARQAVKKEYEKE